MKPPRWTEITQSQFAWERDALAFVREGLPDYEPYRAWSNFEFVSDDGTVNEVDLLVLSPQGFFLVEIKSWPGTVAGDPMTWHRTHEGRVYVDDNPLLLANRKAKKLASLLRRQKACERIRLPFVEPLIFLSHPSVNVQLQGPARSRVCLRDRPEKGGGAPRGIRSALVNRDFDGAGSPAAATLDWAAAKAIGRALEQAGIRPSQRSRRVGDYELGTLLEESPTGVYQDWEATHVAVPSMRRRVRIYNVARGASAELRESIQRAARREFVILEPLSHPGIVQVEAYTKHELGPALVYRHDPSAIRLDHYLIRASAELGVDRRLALVREIAEALKYAHQHRVIHRSLSPQSVYVLESTDGAPRVQLVNWHVSFRDITTGTPLSRISPTAHPDQLVEEASAVYLAPESHAGVENLGIAVDVFSLGAIAYFVFTGRPPASSISDLVERLRESKGLQISAALDAPPRELQELIEYSTHPEVINRLESVDDFLVLLNEAERALKTHDDDSIEDPRAAGGGDRLDETTVVVERLGSGSTAIAFLVDRDGREVVLKLASSADHNDRVQDEFATLQKLRHPSIVEAFEEAEIRGLAGFTMQRAGKETLAKRIRAEGRLSFDDLERFGEDLLGAVDYLEQIGVPHRDIKPENIGVREFGKNKKLHLALFDFSLSRAPLESLRAGTPPYLDPFLGLRRTGRWDLHAERFAVAMTLYEMATGTLPRWGDGQSSPEVLDCEATLHADLFDASLREAMSAFFAKALRRAAAERFDNAEEMLRAWRHVFENANAIAGPSADDSPDRAAELEAAIAAASLASTVAELPLSARAANALDRMGIVTVEQLLAVPGIRFNSLRGVGVKTRRELVETASALRARFPDMRRESVEIPLHTPEPAQPEVMSTDLIAAQVLATPGRAKAEARILHAFLGHDQTEGGADGSWPSQTDVARQLEITRARVGQVVVSARMKWLKNRSVASLGEAVEKLLNASGGAMSVDDLVASVLAQRGSGKDEPERTRLASIAVRAAIESERASADRPRFFDRRTDGRILIAVSPQAADYAEALGAVADQLAAADPLPTPARVVERLREVPAPADLRPVTDARLVRLAAAASKTAAVSSRLEIYPRDMSALRALRLAHGALAGAKDLSEEDVRSRVAGRYPEAEPLPGRPDLDRLLEEAELELRWSADACDGEGGYRLPSVADSTAGSTISNLPRFATRMEAEPPVVAEVKPEVAEARIFERKLVRSLDEGGFLLLATTPAKLPLAEEEIIRRFELSRRDLDALLIESMRQQAMKAKVDWLVVLDADAAARDSREWRNLMALVDRSIPAVEEALAGSEPLLVVNAGLISRYDRMGVIERMRDRANAPGDALHGVWLLVPCDGAYDLPVLDGKPVPVIGPGQWARVPDAWIANAHRASRAGGAV